MVLQSKNDEMLVQEDDVEAIDTDEIQSKLTIKKAMIALKIFEKYVLENNMEENVSFSLKFGYDYLCRLKKLKEDR